MSVTRTVLAAMRSGRAIGMAVLLIICGIVLCVVDDGDLVSQEPMTGQVVAIKESSENRNMCMVTVELESGAQLRSIVDRPRPQIGDELAAGEPPLQELIRVGGWVDYGVRW